jgi:hypothetical protein
MRQRKKTELIKGGLYVGDVWKKPVEVILVDALGEESDDSKEVARTRAKAAECWGIK